MAAQAEQWKNKGNSEYANKNFKEAILSYTKAIELTPVSAPNPALYTNRAAAYAGLFQWEQSLSDSTKSVSIKADWVKGHFRQGLALMELKRYEEAVDSFTRAVKLDAGNADLKNYLNTAEQAKKRVQQERQQQQQKQSAQEQSKPQPKTTTADGKPLTTSMKLKEEGNDHFKVGKIDKAIECYTKAIAATADPNEKAIILCNRAACYVQLYDSNKVVTDCTECLTIQPMNLKALIRRGLAYESLEKMNLALEDLRKVLSVDPSVQVASQGVHRISSALRSQGKPVF